MGQHGRIERQEPSRLDPFTFSLLLGGAGLGAMALTGMVRGGHGHGHASQGHASHGHVAPGHAVAHGPGAGHGDAVAHGHAAGPASHGHAAGHGVSASIGHTLLALASPRILFSLCLGFGTAGLVLERYLGGPLLTLAAVGGAVLFERVLVNPIWRLAFRFESRPAFLLESCVAGEATAVTSFDARGHGLISIELDGQVVQVLGTLQRSDQEMGVRVRPGARLRVEDVNTARNSCTVSLL